MTYDEMASGLGLTRCRGILKTGHYCPVQHHLTGTVTLDGVLHFADRPQTRANVLAFLRLATISLDPSLEEEEYPWRRVYRRHLLVRDCARRLHIPNPAYPAKTERVFVLAGVAGISNEVPMRKQAYDWARRQGRSKKG